MTSDMRSWAAQLVQRLGEGLRRRYRRLVGGGSPQEHMATLRQYARRLEVQHEIDGAILAAQSATEIARVTLGQLRHLVRFDRASVTLFNFDADVVTIVAVEPESASGPAAGEHRPLSDFGRVASLKESRHLTQEDLRAAAGRPGLAQELLAADLRSCICAPLISPEGSIGSLNLGSTRPNAFGEEEMAIAAEAADQLAIAIQQSELIKATRRQVRELSVLHAVATAGAEATSEEALLERATAIIGDNLELENFGIMLLDEEGKRLLVPRSYRGVERDELMRIAVGDGITGRVAASGQPLYVPDVRAADDYIEAAPRTRSELCVPLKVRDRVIGVINAESRKVDYFSEADERLLTTLGQQLATAIEKVRLFEQAQQELQERKRVEAALRQARDELELRVQERTAELTLVNRAARALVSTLELSEVFVIVLEEARRLMDVGACSVWLEDSTTGELVCRHNTGPQSETVQGWRLAPGEGIAGWVTQHGTSLVLQDAQADQRHNKEVGKAINLTTRSILSVPLIVKGKAIGALQVLDSQPNRFDETDLELMESMAAVAASAVDNARLYRLARQDAETKSILLREVNHRVKNNLSVIVGLLYAEQRLAGEGEKRSSQAVRRDLINRIQGLATVHSLLSASEWAPLSLTDLAQQLIRSSLQALPEEAHVEVVVSPSQVRVSPDQAHNLALILNELVTNTIKYALSERSTGRITVDVTEEGGTIEVIYGDDGPGYPEGIVQGNGLEGNVGFRLINNLMERSLGGDLELRNGSGEEAEGVGAVAVLTFGAEV